MNALTRPLPETLAYKGAWCPLCTDRIRPGDDYIAKLPLGWAHARCAANYRRVLAEHDEGGEQ